MWEFDFNIFDKKNMASDLNMLYEKMSDFVSFPLFGFTLVIKLRNFNFESHWNTLRFFDQTILAISSEIQILNFVKIV